MAAVEMGEVDEVNSREGAVKDGVTVNGEACNFTPNTTEISEIKEKVQTTNHVNDDASNDGTDAAGDSDKCDSDKENGADTEEAETEEVEAAEEVEKETNKDEEEEAEEKAGSESPEIVNGSETQGEIMEVDDEDDDVESIKDTEETSDVESVKDVDAESDVKSVKDGEEESDVESVKDDKVTDEKMDVDDEEVSIVEDSSSKPNEEPILLNDSGEKSKDGDVLLVGDDEPVENGIKSPEKNTDAVISLESPVKKKKKAEVPDTPPRRSSRNLNKEKKVYTEDEVEPLPPKLPETKNESSGESDIEEVLPQDPLAVGDPLHAGEIKAKKSRAPVAGATIVVKDTKRLVEIASKSSSPANVKKEPTLVIIDTNSILSGRGPVPIAQKSSISSTITNSYPMLPMALPAQGIYPANMRATITPIPVVPTAPQAIVQSPKQPAAPLLPTLTDDMFVVEAPSFIVPYVYEKPPIKELKAFIVQLKKELEEERKKEEEEEKKKESDEKKDGDDDEEMEKEEDEEDKVESGAKKDVEDEKKDEPIDVEEKLNELKKPPTYFESALGKFFLNIGQSLVQEVVQTDLLKQQKRKRDREGGKNSDTDKTINSLLKNLEYTKENNEAYQLPMKKCEFCSFKTESSLAMAYHLETPHMKNFVYRCNFCQYECD